ncbi:MAG: methyltransferase domain-containing protein [Parashewanella sp.]
MLAEKWNVETSNFSDIDTVASGFSSAATRYTQHNKVQKITSRQLLTGVELKGNVLDLGAGPGTELAVEQGNVFCVDIALGMLQQLSKQYSRYHAINADAHALPLLTNSIGTIVSNLALQWCGDFDSAIAESARVLQKNGAMHVSLVAENSLPQLSNLGFMVNQFRSFSQYKKAFLNGSWDVLEATSSEMTVYFSDLKTLLYSIKGVGASTASNGLPSQLTLRGRKDWLNLLTETEKLMTDKGIPLTYHIVQIRARKS